MKKTLLILILCLPCACLLAQNHVMFSWPLRVTAEYDDMPGYYYIGNYMDQLKGSNKQDYQCDDDNYDDHNGMDISIVPFGWSMMDSNYVDVVAAAPGKVVRVIDNNNNDDNCSSSNCSQANTPNNVIVILHDDADSTISMYYHIKTNSAVVQEGDMVYEGQPICKVASSGCSSYPHLHFEVRTVKGSDIADIYTWNPYNNSNVPLIDPFGACGSIAEADRRTINTDSYWKNPHPYHEPGILRVMTHSGPPPYWSSGCKGVENKRAKNNFSSNDLVRLWIYFSDPRGGDADADVVIYDPSGAEILNGSFHFPSSWNPSVDPLNWHLQLSNAPSGTYKVEATYTKDAITKKAFHYFTVNCVSGYSINHTISNTTGYIAGNDISTISTLTSAANVKLQAGNVITFSPGFTATTGSTLKARIRECDYVE